MTNLRNLLVLLALASTAACATSTQLYSPGPSTLGAEPVTDFDRYVESVKAYVETNLVPVEGFDRGQQVLWNLPYRLAPAAGCESGDSTGILLVHGLSDSPFVFRDLARYLADRCIEVRTLLLQGHGTRPGDMVTASAKVWRTQVRNHFVALSRDVDRAFIGGFSLGGALATGYALGEAGPRPAGLVAVAPAWQLNGLRDYLWLAPIADVFGDFVEKEPELNPVKYESFSFNAGSQIGDVISAAQSRINQQESIDIPLFLAATEADSVINLNYLVTQFRERFTNSGNAMMIFRDTREPWPDTQADDRIRFLNSYLPDSNILEFSHQSLLIAPDNELYGLGAPLQRCLEPNNISLEDCRQLSKKDLWFSAWHDTERPVFTSRLTYNPWFDDLAQAIGSFIQANESTKAP
ncbi:alpha/beta fold hydrolase [uncultured Marinobacter sp.]|uniref:alpha/beta hydrolase n=1 Tax=uncultured Marinobacter sp. TaxID=187379 RepID=UPI0025D9B25D|nr:alpha/beta fold hydrolase [uncultured Marinobacter sp.]